MLKQVVHTPLVFKGSNNIIKNNRLNFIHHVERMKPQKWQWTVLLDAQDPLEARCLSWWTGLSYWGAECSNLDNDDHDRHKHLFFPLSRLLMPVSLVHSRQDHLFVEVAPVPEKVVTRSRDLKVAGIWRHFLLHISCIHRFKALEIKMVRKSLLFPRFEGALFQILFFF